ncbi:hypothetical protein LAZ67_15001778 [Cordylochernes scorpioides]|uniref:Uncharacterized protein n=1 Tax=Cordylochernes scorpioides TaxID=51811 RepID=A0ABY6L998_9ARAC|nr:hypothetical protein LAZ67_15001778 [Cordylochernes scorpioides]
MVQCLKNALKQQDVRAIFPIWEVSESSSRESSEAENRPGLGARLAVPRRAVKHALRQQHKRRKRNTAIGNLLTAPAQCGGSGGEVETVPSSSPCPSSPPTTRPPDHEGTPGLHPWLQFQVSPYIFNLYTEHIERLADLDKIEIENKEDLKDIIEKVKEERGCLDEVKRRIALGRHSMMKLDKIMEDKGISFKKKKRIVEALVFPLVTYGCEGWTRRK